MKIKQTKMQAELDDTIKLVEQLTLDLNQAMEAKRTKQAILDELT